MYILRNSSKYNRDTNIFKNIYNFNYNNGLKCLT